MVKFQSHFEVQCPSMLSVSFSLSVLGQNMSCLLCDDGLVGCLYPVLCILVMSIVNGHPSKDN